MDHTSPTPRRRKGLAIAAALSLAVAVSACSASSGDEQGAGEDGTITLTISTFNEWGYDTLLDQYMTEHPNITIEHNKFATSNEARDQFNTSLAAGSGLADVVGVEVDWMPEIMQYSDQFVDLTSDSVKGRWQDWKVGQATTPDGKLLVGYGTDIGPEAIAYRSDLFAAAGLPTDRADVAELFGGRPWDDFFAVGDQFTAAGTGVPFSTRALPSTRAWSTRSRTRTRTPRPTTSWRSTTPRSATPMTRSWRTPTSRQAFSSGARTGPTASRPTGSPPSPARRG